MGSSLDLAVHHVGGRSGSRRLVVLPTFEADLVNVLYEGDPACIEEMLAASAGLPSRTVALAECIGEAPAPATLRIYRDCGASSLLPLRADYQARFLALGWAAIDHQESAFDTLSTVPVTLAPLDEVLARHGAAVPPPDFLSLNTQGTELAIIRGAAQALRGQTLALQTEVSLFEMYEGQAGLPELMRAAEGLGFLATQVIPHGGWVPSFTLGGQPVRPPIGLRLGGMALQVDLVFFKDPKAILAQHADPQLSLVKAVFLAVALKNYSLSFIYGSQVDRGFLAALPRGEKHYIDFVAAYLGALDRQPQFPAMDFIVTGDALGEKPVGFPAIREFYFRGTDRARFRRQAAEVLAPAFNPLETVCLAFGLPRSAELLRSNRLAGMRELCGFLGLLGADGETLDPAALREL